MTRKQHRENNKVHGIERLKWYFRTTETVLYGQLTGTLQGANCTNLQYQCFVISDGRIVNVSLYVANACGLRRNKHGAVAARSFQDIAELLAPSIGVNKIPYERL